MKNIRIIMLAAAFAVLAAACKKEETPAPGMPEISITLTGENSFEATWTAQDGAVKYGYKTEGTPEFMTEETSAEFTDLEAGLYIFSVRAYSAEGKTSEWASAEIEIAAGLQTPLPVQTGKTESSFTVEWGEISGAGAYEYRIGDSETTVTTQDTRATVDKDGEGNALEAGTEYSFSIRALGADDKTNPSDWTTISVMTEYPPFSATLDIEIKDVTAASFTVHATPSDEVETYYMTLSYSEGFFLLLENLGEEGMIEYILENIGNGVGTYTDEMTQDFEPLRSETGYVVMAAFCDRYGRYGFAYETAVTPEETVPPVESELYDLLAGEWTGTQQGYGFLIPDKTEDNQDPDPVLASETEQTAVFDAVIVKDLGEAYSYQEHNQVCIQFRSFTAGQLDLGYKSYEDLRNEGWSDKDAREGYGPKALIDIKEDGSMSIEGLYGDTPAYTWDERYNYDVTFMNITCDPDDNFMPVGDSLPLTVTLSGDGNTLTISGTFGPGFRYQRSMSAGQLWCAAGDMVLTRVQPATPSAGATMLDLSPLMLAGSRN